MSLRKITKPTLAEGIPNSVPFASSLIDSETITPEEDRLSIIRSESDKLPEKFLSALPPNAVNRPGEMDNAFVREQPW